MIARLGVFLAALTALAVAPAAAQVPVPTPPADLVPTAVPAEPPAASVPPSLQASSAILVDLSSGKVLYEKELHARLPPASLTKIATAITVRERFGLDEVVTVTDDVNTVRGGKVGLKPGMQFTVSQLLHALLIVSANDAATALAAHDPGGIAAFMVTMNETARAIGATESSFLNPHGLDEPGHLSSAWDMAILGRRLMADPVLAGIVRMPSFNLTWVDGAVRVLQNHNKLLNRYAGAIGVKTGYTNEAGRCLVAAAETTAGTALTVVMRAPDHYAETTALLEYFKTKPTPLRVAPVRPRSAASARSRGAIRLPTPSPKPKPAERAQASAPVRSTTVPLGRLAPLTTALALAMLATLWRPRRRHPLRDAAQFHAYLEPFADGQAASNGRGGGAARRDDLKSAGPPRRP